MTKPAKTRIQTETEQPTNGIVINVTMITELRVIPKPDLTICEIYGFLGYEIKVL